MGSQIAVAVVVVVVAAAAAAAAAVAAAAAAAMVFASNDVFGVVPDVAAIVIYDVNEELFSYPTRIGSTFSYVVNLKNVLHIFL